MLSKWNFRGERRPSRSEIKGKSKTDLQILPPWVKSVTKNLQSPRTTLVLVNNLSGADRDRNKTDEELAKIGLIGSQLAGEIVSGREPQAIATDHVCPPCTFSTVQEFFPYSAITLAQQWEEEGMPTLLPHNILPPQRDTERRMAILYGVGDISELQELEELILNLFDPSIYEKSFTSYDGLPSHMNDVTQFFVQWELTDDEAAAALGVSNNSPEFSEIMDLLSKKSKSVDKDRKHKFKTSCERNWSSPNFSSLVSQKTTIGGKEC